MTPRAISLWLVTISFLLLEANCIGQQLAQDQVESQGNNPTPRKTVNRLQTRALTPAQAKVIQKRLQDQQRSTESDPSVSPAGPAIRQAGFSERSPNRVASAVQGAGTELPRTTNPEEAFRQLKWTSQLLEAAGMTEEFLALQVALDEFEAKHLERMSFQWKNREQERLKAKPGQLPPRDETKSQAPDESKVLQFRAMIFETSVTNAEAIPTELPIQEFQALVQNLTSKKDIDVRSRPVIRPPNGQTSEIFSGTFDADVPPELLSEFEAGIRLEVCPRVAGDGRVQLVTCLARTEIHCENGIPVVSRSLSRNTVELDSTKVSILRLDEPLKTGKITLVSITQSSD